MAPNVNELRAEKLALEKTVNAIVERAGKNAERPAANAKELRKFDEANARIAEINAELKAMSTTHTADVARRRLQLLKLS